MQWINRLFGVVVLADLAARIFISRRPTRELIRPLTVAEIVAAISFLWPLGGGAFLRALRTLRLLRSYAFIERLRGASTWFRRNEEAVVAGTNLFIFIFVMTGVVYDTQHWSNPHITNYADALYFTVTTLTTTGFGDITLPGTFGRMITVMIMICGVTLFFRLAQVLFRPTRVRSSVRIAACSGTTMMPCIARLVETCSTSPTRAQCSKDLTQLFLIRTGPITFLRASQCELAPPPEEDPVQLLQEAAAAS